MPFYRRMAEVSASLGCSAPSSKFRSCWWKLFAEQISGPGTCNHYSYRGGADRFAADAADDPIGATGHNTNGETV